MARVGGSSIMALKKKIISKFFNYRMTDNDSCSFRNSNFINYLSRVSGRFNSWLWHMQYGREEAKKST